MNFISGSAKYVVMSIVHYQYAVHVTCYVVQYNIPMLGLLNSICVPGVLLQFKVLLMISFVKVAAY